MEEPSILDYLKSKLNPWQHNRLEIPTREAPETNRSADESASFAGGSPQEVSQGASLPLLRSLALPWRSLTGLFLALIAQSSLAPHYDRHAFPGILMLIISLGLLVWATWTDELSLTAPKYPSMDYRPPTINMSSLLIGFLLAVAAFLAFGSLQFSFFNIILLVLALYFIARGLWIQSGTLLEWATRTITHLRLPPWKISIQRSTLIVFAALIMAGFFRFYRLGDIPPEMNSDHAEKILDILSILAGRKNVFFPSNGGREALQFYLVAGLHRLTGLPLSFLILKLITGAVGFLALPFIYFLGKELGDRRAGFLAFLFAGIAYWPNVVSRVGLRLPFQILFSAALFYVVIRGLRRESLNAFIIAGIVLGLSLYGYSASRILPLLVITAIALFMIHHKIDGLQPAKGRNLFALTALAVTSLVSMVIFLPIIRYIIADPSGFFMRTLTRMASLEKPISSPIIQIFIKNTGRALAMFSWDAGMVWPISIPGYPALSIVSGGLFYCGLALITVRYLRQRNWPDLLMLVSIPILLLPSILSFAFPEENPNLYRTGGAIIPVFLLVGMALSAMMGAVEKLIPTLKGKSLAIGLAILLLGFNAVQDYYLVFNRYYNNYRISAWNSSEMGIVARSFIDIHQVPDNVWVVGYPNWVDTRLVANNAGFPGRDFELKIEDIPNTVDFSGPKLFILNTQDVQGLQALEQSYPQSYMEIFHSQTPTKDFIIFNVLPEGVSD